MRLASQNSSEIKFLYQPQEGSMIILLVKLLLAVLFEN